MTEQKQAAKRKVQVDIDEDMVEGTASDAVRIDSLEEVKVGDELESYIEDIADTVRIGLDQSIAILTPWFFNNRPRIY